VAEAEASTPTKAKRKFHVDINLDWCKSCYICIKICPADVFHARPVDEKSEVIDHARCIGCMMCEQHCPDFAIEVTKDESTSE